MSKLHASNPTPLNAEIELALDKMIAETRPVPKPLSWGAYMLRLHGMATAGALIFFIGPSTINPDALSDTPDWEKIFPRNDQALAISAPVADMNWQQFEAYRKAVGNSIVDISRDDFNLLLSYHYTDPVRVVQAYTLQAYTIAVHCAFGIAALCPPKTQARYAALQAAYAEYPAYTLWNDANNHDFIQAISADLDIAGLHETEAEIDIEARLGVARRVSEIFTQAFSADGFQMPIWAVSAADIPEKEDILGERRQPNAHYVRADKSVRYHAAVLEKSAFGSFIKTASHEYHHGKQAFMAESLNDPEGAQYMRENGIYEIAQIFNFVLKYRLPGYDNFGYYLMSPLEVDARAHSADIKVVFPQKEAAPAGP